MDTRAIREKFGEDYVADDRTFLMGIDLRLARRIAHRFEGRTVLESCTGGGFTTVELARVAARVITVEIDAGHQAQARSNVAKAGLLHRVAFLHGDALDEHLLEASPPVDAAFLDPDWAVTGPAHVYRFRESNTQPPADVLLERVLGITPDVALVLPPKVDTRELEGLPVHERQKLYLDGILELYCLFFGSLAFSPGVTALHV